MKNGIWAREFGGCVNWSAGKRGGRSRATVEKLVDG